MYIIEFADSFIRPMYLQRIAISEGNHISMLCDGVPSCFVYCLQATIDVPFDKMLVSKKTSLNLKIWCNSQYSTTLNKLVLGSLIWCQALPPGISPHPYF